MTRFLAHPFVFLFQHRFSFFMYEYKCGYVFIDAMKFHSFHGVIDQERLTGNDYTVSVRAGYDITRAMQTDDVNHTLNYAAVYEVVRREMDRPSKLIEHVAGRIAESLFESFPLILSLDVKIVKHNPPMGADCSGAGVEIHLTNYKTK